MLSPFTFSSSLSFTPVTLFSWFKPLFYSLFSFHSFLVVFFFDSLSPLPFLLLFRQSCFLIISFSLFYSFQCLFSFCFSSLDIIFSTFLPHIIPCCFLLRFIISSFFSWFSLCMLFDVIAGVFVDVGAANSLIQSQN